MDLYESSEYWKIMRVRDDVNALLGDELRPQRGGGGDAERYRL